MAGTAAKQFIGAILLIIAACTNVRSATIQETDNKLCAFRLEGVISNGDSETFSQLIRRNLSRMHELDSRTRTLCLKSVGGSYFEALRISELVYNRGISTLIEYGSQCFSACAVIFMAGVTSDKDGPIILLDCTSIERAPKSAEERRAADRVAEQILQTANENQLFDRVELLRGSVEDIICDGLDVFGAPVPHSVGEHAHDSQFEYDLYNLDFTGGLGYRAKTGKPKRIRSLEKLFQRQSGRDFILLLTINVRDTLRETVVEYLERLRGDVGDILDWYIARQDGEYDHQLKAAVPLFLRTHAEAAGFDCTFLPPVSYIGFEEARLVHFVCRFKAASNVFPATSVQTRADVVGLPLIDCKDGVLRVSTLQHPQFSLQRCRAMLAGCCAEINAVLS
jgi:hypothetical protein